MATPNRFFFNGFPTQNTKSESRPSSGYTHNGENAGPQLRPGRAHAALRPRTRRAGRRVVARRASYRVASRVLSYRRTPVVIQNCIVTPRPIPRALRAMSRLRVAALGALCRNARPPSCHDTNNSAARPCARARCLPRAQAGSVAGRFARVACLIVALLRAPARTRSAVSCPGAPAMSRYNMMYRDQ